MEHHRADLRRRHLFFEGLEARRALSAVPQFVAEPVHFEVSASEFPPSAAALTLNHVPPDVKFANLSRENAFELEERSENSPPDSFVADSPEIQAPTLLAHIGANAQPDLLPLVRDVRLAREANGADVNLLLSLSGDRASNPRAVNESAFAALGTGEPAEQHSEQGDDFDGKLSDTVSELIRTSLVGVPAVDEAYANHHPTHDGHSASPNTVPSTISPGVHHSIERRPANYPPDSHVVANLAPISVAAIPSTRNAAVEDSFQNAFEHLGATAAETTVSSFVSPDGKPSPELLPLVKDLRLRHTAGGGDGKAVAAPQQLDRSAGHTSPASGSGVAP